MRSVQKLSVPALLLPLLEACSVEADEIMSSSSGLTPPFLSTSSYPPLQPHPPSVSPQPTSQESGHSNTGWTRLKRQQVAAACKACHRRKSKVRFTQITHIRFLRATHSQTSHRSAMECGLHAQRASSVAFLATMTSSPRCPG